MMPNCEATQMMENSACKCSSTVSRASCSTVQKKTKSLSPSFTVCFRGYILDFKNLRNCDYGNYGLVSTI
jgi:hypothetical protein